MLREVVFLFRMLSPRWVSAALRTITENSRNLEQIVIYVPYLPNTPSSTPQVPALPMRLAKEAAVTAYSELDRLLVKFHELYSITPRFVCTVSTIEGVKGLLPELTKLNALKWSVRAPRPWVSRRRQPGPHN